MKYLEIFEQMLNEINMSPSSLRTLASRIDARAGMEFEMIVPGVGGADEYGESEPDYDQDERIRRFRDIHEFFYDGDYNSRRDVERLTDQIWSDYQDSDWLSERKQEEWSEAAYSSIKDLVDRDYADDLRDQATDEVSAKTPEFGVNGEEFETAVLQRYKELLEEKIDDILANMGPEYDEAYEEWEEEVWQDLWNDDDMFTDWAEEEGMSTMSDITSNYDINWPHWTSPESEGEMDIEQVADEFGTEIGRPVNWSRNYHGGKRAANTYVVEPDGSLEGDEPGDSGLEFVSPPLPIQELLSDLKKVKAWAGRIGAYTNESTGLHINVSVPGWQGNLQDLDYVKLAILLGDEYVLEQFGRNGNTYCKSAFEIVKSHVRQRPQDAEALLKQMKDHLNSAASKLIHTGVTSKYTSINNKSGYIEFRSPGGDWLDENFDKIENTLLRFVVALDAAVDPDKYKEEYAKKLYKLLSASNDTTDTLQYFAQYSAGTLPRSALTSFVKQAQLQRKLKKGPTGEKYWWNVSNPGNSYAGIEVVATSKEEAIEKALGPDGYPSWASNRNSLVAKPLRPFDSGATRPARAEEIPEVPLDIEIAAPRDNWSQDFERRMQARPNVGTQTDMENRLGWGSQSDDANYEIVNRANNQSVFRFIANTPQEAQRKFEDWLAAAGYPNDTEDFGFRALSR